MFSILLLFDNKWNKDIFIHRPIKNLNNIISYYIVSLAGNNNFNLIKTK